MILKIILPTDNEAHWQVEVAIAVNSLSQQLLCCAVLSTGFELRNLLIMMSRKLAYCGSHRNRTTDHGRKSLIAPGKVS